MSNVLIRIAYAREMSSRAGTFFDQEALEAYAEAAGEGGARTIAAIRGEG